MTNLEKMKKDMIDVIQNMTTEEFYSFTILVDEEYEKCKRGDKSLYNAPLPKSILACENCKVRYKDCDCENSASKCMDNFIKYCDEEYVE